MKRAKKLYILLGCLVVIIAATLILMRSEEKKEEIQNSDEVILSVDPDTVTALSWSYDETSLGFAKDEDGNWIYDDDEEFPVSSDKMSEMLSVFEEFGVSFVIENVEDYDQYGLEDPTATIHLETEDETYEITLGNFSNMDEERYVSIGDGNVYLVTTDPMDTYEVTLEDMVDNDELLAYSAISRIQIAGDEEYSIAYDEDSDASYCEDDVYFVEDGDDLLPLDTARVTSYLNAVSSIDESSYVTYKATDDDLATYGLDDPELTVTIDYTPAADDASGDNGADDSDEIAEETYTFSISRSAADKEKGDVSEDDTDFSAYLRIGESSIIYKISGDSYLTLMAASYDDLRHEAVYSGSFDQITSMDVTLDGETYTLTAEGEDDDITWTYEDEKIDASDLQSTLEALVADSFTDKEPDDQEEISVVLHLDDENFPEVEITLYRYDGNDCLAVVDGESVALVARSYVVNFMEAVRAIVL